MEAVQILVNEICPTSTQAWIKKGALLVDVREQEEVDQLAFDVPEIVNIPLTEFEVRYKELRLDRNLVIVCRNGARSLRAAGFLIHNGYDAAKVVNMKHGLIRWVQKGFAIKGDASGIDPMHDHSGCCGGAHKLNHEDEPCC